jgi:hypothetical protein
MNASSANDSTLVNAPIFIVGTPRSGTTLTARILGTHSAVFTGPEASLLSKVYARRATLGDPASDADAMVAVTARLRQFYDHPRSIEKTERLFAETDLTEALRAARSYRQAFETFMGYLAKANGKRRWATHAHGDVFELEQLFEVFPNARVIVCSRHVLDFLVSYRDKWQRAQRLSEQAGEDTKGLNARDAVRLRKLYHPVTTSLLWLGSVRRALAGLQRWGDHMFLSRYEDLVQDPEGHIRKICDFVGVPFESQMVDLAFDNSSRQMGVKGIFNSSVGRWRETLTDSEAFVAQLICAGGMRKLGYERIATRPNPVAVLRYLLGAPIHAVQAVLANRRHRDVPVPVYLAKRLAAFVHR